MHSLILSTSCRLLLPLLLLFSLFLLLRGHNETGGGFVGGLVAASAFALNALAQGIHEGKQALGLEPRLLVVSGLLLALLAGSVSLIAGFPFMTGFWSEITVPAIGSLGTPLLFDTGVYLVVTGAVLLIVFSLMED